MNATVHTRYASLSDLPALDALAADRWLSPDERQAWRRMRSAERRATWLAGRIAAKQLLAQCLTDAGDERTIPAAVEFHVESNGGGRGQRPSVFVAGRPLAWALSIAHTARGVLAAVSAERGVTLGVDLVGQPSPGFARLAWCFTPAERRWLAAGPAHARSIEQLWAMKEALYKASQQGEGFAPRQIEMVPGREPRYAMLNPARAVRSVQSWRVDGHFAALAVVEPVGDGMHSAKSHTSDPCAIGSTKHEHERLVERA